MNGGRIRAAILGAALAVTFVASGAAPDPDALRRGEHIYERCSGCHSIEGNRTGPQHCGLFGRRAGSAPGYDGYSSAMLKSGIVWNDRTLDKFLQEPLKKVPGTAMGYAGVKDAAERADLIAWMRRAAAPEHCRVRP